jgi:hypothetical protein
LHPRSTARPKRGSLKKYAKLSWLTRSAPNTRSGPAAIDI